MFEGLTKGELFVMFAVGFGTLSMTLIALIIIGSAAFGDPATEGLGLVVIATICMAITFKALQKTSEIIHKSRL